MVPGSLEKNARRNEIPEEISQRMGGTSAKARESVLRVLNGGSIAAFFRAQGKTQAGNQPLLCLPALEAPQVLRSINKSGILCGRSARQIPLS